MANEMALRSEVTPTSLTVPETMTIEQWLAEFRLIEMIQGATLWWCGDMLNQGERMYGESYSQAVDETGYARTTLYNSAYVCKRVPPEIRRESLSYAHHQAVAAVMDDEGYPDVQAMDRWLSWAEPREGFTKPELTAAQLRAEIQAAKQARVSHASETGEKPKAEVEGPQFTKSKPVVEVEEQNGWEPADIEALDEGERNTLARVGRNHREQAEPSERLVDVYQEEMWLMEMNFSDDGEVFEVSSELQGRGCAVQMQGSLTEFLYRNRDYLHGGRVRIKLEVYE